MELRRTVREARWPVVRSRRPRVALWPITVTAAVIRSPGRTLRSMATGAAGSSSSHEE